MKFYLKYIFFLLSFSAFGQEVEWVVEPKLLLDYVSPFKEGMAIVKSEGNNSYDFVNTTGLRQISTMTNSIYDVRDFSNGLTWFKKNEKYGYIDKGGHVVILPIYESATLFSEGLAEVKLNGKIGFIDTTGKIQIPFEFDACGGLGFSEGICTVRKGSKWGIINRNNKLIVPFVLNYDIVGEFHDGLAKVEKMGLVDKIGYIDTSGNERIKLRKMTLANDFNNGFAWTKINDKRGFINKVGSFVFEYDKKNYFYHSDGFKEGITYRFDDNTIQWIDTTGKVLFSYPRESILNCRDFSDGLALVFKGYEYKNGYGFIDKTGKIVIPFQFEDARTFSEGFAWVKLNGKWGIIKNPLLKKEEKPTKFLPNAAIQIFWKTDSHTAKSNTATIKSIISGNDIKPEQIKILVNDKSQNGQKLGETSLKSNQNRYNWQGVVSLQEGENEIVLAIQQPNQADVRSEPLIIRYEEPTKPNLYIVSVGVKGLGLKYTPNDAQKISEVFKNQKGKLFGQVNISTYNQEQNTTAESLKNGIGELSSIGITPNDVLVVFVSAHGEKISKRDGKTDFAVLTSNYNTTNIFTKENTSLLYESHIIEYLKPIDCKKLILLDACHSGQATEQNIGGAKTRYLQDLQEAQEVVKRTPSGFITIASTSGELSSYEDDLWQNGAFTKALVDGLNGKADVNGDRYIYVGELFKYIEKTVPIIVNQAKKQRQEPKIYPEIIGSDKDFPVFQYMP